jgi:tRNA nucleotidyltransferase (CCA-adding enzyme)
MAAPREIDLQALPGFAKVRTAAERAGVEAYLVGGAVRDALLGRDASNLDVVVIGDPLALAEGLGGEARVHDRFETATVDADGHPIDIARARTETYEHPGALPTVAATDRLEDDLDRRDFTVNAIAVPFADPGRVIDPHGGIGDLEARLLRVLHEGSFADDPTRALRAARYASRLELELEPATSALARRADLSTVSADRVEADLRRLAAEASPRAGFELLADWGLIDLADGAGDLMDAIGDLTAREPWSVAVDRAEAILGAVRGAPQLARELGSRTPASPSEAVEAARGRSPTELALARALGAEWLDDYLNDWRGVRLEISGEDLLAAGVPEGPAVGRGLEAALRAKLDGELTGRQQELRAALDAAGHGR